MPSVSAQSLNIHQHIPVAAAGLVWVGLLVLLAFQGCATLEVVTAQHLHEQRLTADAAPIAHIYADNWGVYLFKYVPIVSGNLDKPRTPQLPMLFTDNVRVELLVDQVTQEGHRLGGTLITDLRTRDRSYWLPWLLIFWLNEFEVSANASRPFVAVEKQQERTAEIRPPGSGQEGDPLFP
jgi:hypothetical protein